jgi:DNA-directed RNA polymerase subunit H (RpoH/RPB5)
MYFCVCAKLKTIKVKRKEKEGKEKKKKRKRGEVFFSVGITMKGSSSSSSPSSAMPPPSRKRKAPARKGTGTERQSREDPLLASANCVPTSFTWLDDLYSCHSRLDNPKDTYELFCLCRTLYKMMIVHRGFMPSSEFGLHMYQLLHEHAYSESEQGLIRLLYHDVLNYWNRVKSTHIATTVIRVIRCMQDDTWFPVSRSKIKRLPCPTEGMRLLFLLPKKIGVAHIRNMIQACCALAPNPHFFVVHRGKLTVDCLNTLDDFNRQYPNLRMEHHLWDTLLLYPYDYKIVPWHRLASIRERDTYVREHSLDFNKLMPLHIHDPMVRFHDFSVGDAVVVIEREASGHVMQMFRVVRNRQEGLEGSQASSSSMHGDPSGDPTDKSHSMQPLLTKPIHTLPTNAKKTTQLRKG